MDTFDKLLKEIEDHFWAIILLLLILSGIASWAVKMVMAARGKSPKEIKEMDDL